MIPPNVAMSMAQILVRHGLDDPDGSEPASCMPNLLARLDIKDLHTTQPGIALTVVKKADISDAKCLDVGVPDCPARTVPTHRSASARPRPNSCRS